MTLDYAYWWSAASRNPSDRRFRSPSLSTYGSPAPMRENAFRKKFGRALRAAREGKGLTQRELAEAAGLAEKYLSRIELGGATPSIFIAARLASVLGVTLDDLAAAEPAADSAELGAIVRLLRGRSDAELARLRRALGELLRP